MVRLTKAQRAQLTVANAVGGGWYPGSKGASSCRSLVRRGLMWKHGESGPYSLTDAGRATITTQDTEGGE